MTDTPPVTVTPVPLTKETYLELQEALDELDRAFKHPTAESINARRWLHYRWLVEGKPPSVDNKQESVKL